MKRLLILREAVALHMEGENPADFDLIPNPSLLVTMELEPEWCRLPIRRLSGTEIVAIFKIFGFETYSQKGSHMKLRRLYLGGKANSHGTPTFRT